MKKKNILLEIILLFILIGCSSVNQPDENWSYRGKTTSGKRLTKDYDLDYVYFKKNNLPIPDNFKGKGQDYLVLRNETMSKYGYDFFTKFDDNKILKFYQDLGVKGYGDNSPYWRWKTTLTKTQFFTAIKNNLPSVYRARPSEVLTLSNGAWERLPITSSNIGEIKKVEVAARGRSGVVTYLVITTTKKKILVAKELNVRKLFAFTNRNTGNRGDILLYGAKGEDKNYMANPIRTNFGLLPSGYFAIDYSKNNVTIYGGGNGHGVGMSQFAVYDLATNYNYGYNKILKRSYPNTKIKNMYSIKGIGKIIKVGITNRYGGLDHKKIVLVSNGKIDIDGSGFNIKVPPKQKIVIENKGKRLWVSVNGKHRVKTYNPLEITAHGYYITIEGLKRMHTWSPQYRGEMTIKASSSDYHGIRVINRVKIEDYLKQVVPSEMPQSFGVESLKAQAVAARTYALSDYMKNRYEQEGFHVKDTTESQVYNNQNENPDATKAVEKTAGEVITFEDMPIDAKYFSTSSGFIESSNYIW